MQLERKHLAPETVAKRLGVSVDSVYRLVRSGELAGVRVGRRYVISDEALAEFLERAEHDDTDRLFRHSLELGRLYLDRALREAVGAYFELAEAKLRRAASLRPTDPLPAYELVRALVMRGNDHDAEDAFTRLEEAQQAALTQRRRERRLPRG